MAQNNRLKYYISFEADTKKAKSQIDDMMRSLQQINTPKNIAKDFFNNADLREARTNIMQLEQMLQKAMNVDTGRLDLTKLDRSLKQSGVSLSTFRKSFAALGDEGAHAFTKITEAVMQGEIPLKRQSALFTKMAETMKNTIRWQISATALNAFTTSIRNAYRYAEDLNRSLNDIRIVTGQSVEQMDAFATKANRAARELSVSTKAYADAALIFYQQGLDDNEVLERTNAVMKMSNVTGEAAADVSSYMTAIWNNFDDGSKSLEYYGDVITKLGAVTAASSEEIAGGMEKFAAVADTVGLSYEYASAALATIIDRTRQSEDVVGTSLRTIFARLSSLSLGETLEDGVDLTKYTKALKTVGVEILDQNDQLKSMDTILDELGTKWGGLNGAQKQALATTVAGVRQYSQLIALMDNYDLFKVNVDLAIDSDGTLTEQSKIFEESWLGAKKRVTAALEGIYDTLLEDKVFIVITNGIASIIEAVDWLIDRAGGLPTVLSLVAIGVQKLFGSDIKMAIDAVIEHFKVQFGITQTEVAQRVKEFGAENNKLYKDLNTAESRYAAILKENAFTLANQLVTLNQLKDVDLERVKIATSLSASYAKAYDYIAMTAEKIQQDLNKEILLNKKQVPAELLEVAQKDYDAIGVSQYFDERLKPGRAGLRDDATKFLREKMSRLESGTAEYDKYESILQRMSNPLNKTAGQKLFDESIKDFQDDKYLSAEFVLRQKYGIGESANKIIDARLDLMRHKDALESKQLDAMSRAKEDPNVKNAIEVVKMAQTPEELVATQSILNEALQEYAKNAGLSEEETKELEAALEKYKEAVKNVSDAEKAHADEQNRLRQNSENVNLILKDGFSIAMQGVSAISAFSAGIKVLGDENMSAGQKLLSFTTSMSMAGLQMMSVTEKIGRLKKTWAETDVAAGILAKIPFKEKLVGDVTDASKALGILGVKFGLVAAAAMAFFAVWKIWEEQKPETAIKRAEERTREAQKAAAEAKQEYLELKNTIDGFTDQYNAIEDMVVGTEEWAAAVSKVNDNLQEVIDKYGLVKGEHFYVKNGMLILTAAGEKEVLKGEKAEADAAEIKADVEEVRTEELKREQANNNFNKLLNDTSFDIFQRLDMEDLESTSLLDIEQKIKNIFQNENPLNYTLVEFEKALEEAGIKATDPEAYRLFNAWQDKNINDSGFTADFAQYTSEQANEEGLATEQASVLGEGYYNKIAEVIASTNSQTLENAGIKYLTYDERKKYNTEDSYGQFDKSGKLINTLKDYQDAVDYFAYSIIGTKEDYAEKHGQEALEKARSEKASYWLKDGEAEEEFENLRQQRVENRKVKSEIDDKELDQYINYLDEFIDHTDEAKEEFTDEMLEELAVANMRFNKGMEDLLDNWTEYKQILNETSKSTEEYASTLRQMQQTMAEIAGVDASDISEAFLLNTENQELLDKAYLGDLEAVYELRKNLATDFADDIGILNDDLSNAIDLIDMANTDIKVGMTLDDAAVQEVYGNIVKIIDDLMRAGQLTGEQAQKLLNMIGLAGQIKIAEVKATDVNRLTNTTIIDGKEYTVTSDLTSEGTYHVPTLDTSSIVVEEVRMNSANTKKAAGNASSRRKNTKKVDDEIERYHLIKETIEDLNRELDRLGKEKDRAWGNAHLQYIDREITKTEEAIDAQKEYLRQIEENYGKDRGKLAGYGGQFDENGRLTNYEELMQAQIAAYNAAVRSGSETQQEAAEEQYNNFKKALEQYEETADLFESEYEQLLDLQNQYYDKLLERIQYKVEVDVQISEEADKYYDYILDMLEDKAYSAAEAIAYLGKKTEESLKRIASYQEALNSMFEMHGFGDDAYERFANGELSIEELATAGFTSQEIDMLIEYRGALMEENKQLMEMRDQVMSSLTDTFDEYMDTLDKMIDKFDHLNAVTSAYKNIVDIVGKKALGISNDMLKAMDEATVATAENTVKASKDRLDAAEAAMADMEKLEADYQEAMANANKATSEDEKLYWLGEAQGISDAMEHIEEESRAAKEAFLGSWEEALTTAREVFESNVQLAMEKFEDAVSGIYGSLDAMKEAYDQNKVLREQYLEEYERIYELNKLNRDITNSIDDIDSIAAKQALRDLQEEINELQRSGAQISKYDLDMLRMRYELRLAEIALEDAQNAKSQVRMSRDNDGNWSYVYTADEGAVADAQQGYEDKMMAMQQSSNDYLNQMSEQWIAAEIEMEQAYQKIWEDRTLSDEERAAAIDRLYEYYGERFNFFNDQITNALGNNKILYEEDWLAWADKNNIQIESNDSFLTNFEDTVLGVTTGFDDVDTLHQELLDAVGRPGEGGYLGDLDEAYTDWQENVSDIMNAAGTSVTDFGDDFAEVAEDTVEDSAEMAEEVENMSETMKDAFEDVVGAVKDWRKEYSDVIAANIRQNSNMINSLASLLDRINKTIDAQIKLNSVTGEGPTSATGSYVGNEIDRNSGGPGETQTEKYWRYGSFKSKDYKVVVDYLHSLALESGDDYDAFWNREYPKIQYYNTGGYTGAWGADGRLAMLHEKELVLNKDDTANFLSAINIVRDIVKVVDMNAAISGMGIGALAAGGIAGAGSTIEQSVTIYADFPNATDHSEIELALANLMNSASQYANRKG